MRNTNILKSNLTNFLVMREKRSKNIYFRNSRSVKKLFLEISQNSQENTSKYNFIKKESLAQAISSEFCEISKNIFSYRTPPVAASVI